MYICTSCAWGPVIFTVKQNTSVSLLASVPGWACACQRACSRFPLCLSFMTSFLFEVWTFDRWCFLRISLTLSISFLVFIKIPRQGATLPQTCFSLFPLFHPCVSSTATKLYHFFLAVGFTSSCFFTVSFYSLYFSIICYL